MYPQRLDDLRARLADAGFDAGIFTDDDTVYYLTGFYGPKNWVMSRRLRQTCE
jgi:Xaa-Pro aminopeptidase